ncbi:hypothetical protein TNCV_2115561 [Trichonephila clavipes]|nr:hypothetical protein TNCV_2115561 [Trichonephila clavipes]
MKVENVTMWELCYTPALFKLWDVITLGGGIILNIYNASNKKFGQVKRRLIRSKTSVNAESERLDVSASKKKIEKSEGSFKDYEDNFQLILKVGMLLLT